HFRELFSPKKQTAILHLKCVEAEVWTRFVRKLGRFCEIKIAQQQAIDPYALAIKKCRPIVNQPLANGAFFLVPNGSGGGLQVLDERVCRFQKRVAVNQPLAKLRRVAKECGMLGPRMAEGMSDFVEA